MRKSDKKIDNALREALTEVCEIALEKYEGFIWLTHLANYNNFPDSLSIVCVFDTNAQLSAFFEKNLDKELSALINEHLIQIDVKVKDARKQIHFDTEENCSKQHEGKWDIRLKHH